MVPSVETIIEGNTTYDTEDYTIKEVVDFIKGFTENQLLKIQSFLENYPRLSKKIEFICPMCKAKLSITVEGLNNFF